MRGPSLVGGGQVPQLAGALGNVAGAVPFSGGAPGVAGAMPQGFSPGGLQMPQGIGLLPLGIGGGFGGQEGGPAFQGFSGGDSSVGRRSPDQAFNYENVPTRQYPEGVDMQSLVASAQGASRAAQPASGGIDFEAIARFFQSGGPQSRAILGPGGFNNFVGNISTIFNPVQSAISSGAQSILALLKGRNNNGRA